MQAPLGEVFFAVAEGRFDDQRSHVQLVHAPPESRIALGIAGEYPAALVRRHRVPNGGNRMNCGQYLDTLTGDVQRLAYLYVVKTDEGGLGRRNATEVGPDDVVEDMGLECRDGARQCVDLDGLG